MDTTTEISPDAPKSRGVFGKAFVALVLIANLVILAVAWQDKSWAALWMGLLIGPILNGAFLISGLVAIPFLRRRRASFRLGRHLALTIGLPVAAVVADLFIINSMGFHGC